MTAGIERAAHAYCRVCHPDPRLGEPVTALCGATHPYWGRRERPVNNCPACAAVVARTEYPCGHTGAER
ncbi:hypothetical protein ABTX61_10095 [Amycolatopsis japonica]|uniref:hypothetical protein n=1 Tax=Amycolatopsis japonica TaxID=208439 RepID=UPI00332F0A45